MLESGLKTSILPNFVTINSNFVPQDVRDKVYHAAISDPSPPIICDGKMHSWACDSLTCPSMKDYLCTLCDTTGNKSKVKDSEQLKKFATSISNADLMSKKCFAPECFNGGKCIQDTSIGEAYDLLLSFWGENFFENPKVKERRKKIDEWFTRAFINEKNEFQFTLPNTGRRVCERAMLALLGLSLEQHLSRAPSSWIKARKAKLEVLNTHQGHIPLSQVKRKLDSTS
jgi:hypothetical protein